MIAAKSSVAAHAVENVSAGPESRVCEAKINRTPTRVQRIDVEMIRAQGLASRCLADAMGVHRLSIEAFSQACGCSATFVRRWLEPGDDSTITTKRMILASQSRKGRQVVLTYMAALRSHLDSEVTAQEEPVPPSQRMLNLMVEAGELAQSLRAGLSDGVLDKEEKTDVLREIEHLRAQLDGLERDIRRS